MTLNTLDALFEHELKDIYDAEKRLTKALPKMAKAASSDELRNAFEQHLQVTQNQVARLEKIFEILEIKPKAKTCAGMKGLIEEGEEIIGTEAEDALLDVAIAGAARKVENYEITAYRSLNSMAEILGDQEVQDLLDETLREEEDADQQLASIAEGILESLSEEEEEEVEVEDEDEDEESEMTMEEEEEEPEITRPVPTGPTPGRRK